MLDDGGDCLLTFVANTPTHSIFQALADEKNGTKLETLSYILSEVEEQEQKSDSESLTLS
ncbi:hypothetical protein K1T71_008606 [Dendrolimus kikuchii]|uniref:Uncharacterized protein n=1 Tax=Dendrolimus kikuchii TaxID=765133 RepID=A0ACC1CWG3_9NEOP|nr:hypothetical protein K1T71_008606 [Dendrolimus kikuchii]